MYKLIREDIVIKLGARFGEGGGDSEGINGGDVARYGGSGDLGGGVELELVNETVEKAIEGPTTSYTLPPRARSNYNKILT